jgi:hypothetical protein
MHTRRKLEEIGRYIAQNYDKENLDAALIQNTPLRRVESTVLVDEYDKAIVFVHVLIKNIFESWHQVLFYIKKTGNYRSFTFVEVDREKLLEV